MTDNLLTQAYKKDPLTQSIESCLTHHEKSNHIMLKGLSGSMLSCIASAIVSNNNQNHFFVFPNKEAAAYFYADLSNLLKNNHIFLFVDNLSKANKRQKEENDLLQNEVLKKIYKQDKTSIVIISYSEAIIEKIVPKQTIRQYTYHIELNQELPLDDLIQYLEKQSFTHTDFVCKAGQFSIRGGIVDIFSYGNPLPYRIELFDTEVESIRLFDIETQLSTKKIHALSITPRLKTISEKKRVPLWEIFSNSYTVWVKDEEEISASIKHLLQALQENTQNAPQHFTTEKAFEQLLQKQKTIYIGKTSHKIHHTITYHSNPQPSFNKNFQLLADTFIKQSEKKMINYISSNNPKQIKRFKAIFDDINKSCSFTPVQIALHEGFIDTQLGLCCFTDHQIFNRFHKYHIKRGYNKSQALFLKEIKQMLPGDFITHIDHGVGKYSGLQTIEVNGKKQEVVRILYANDDILYVHINALHKISKYRGKEGVPPRINKLGSDTWQKLKQKTKRKIKDIAEDLIQLYATRKTKKGFSFSPDTYMQTELESSFIYEDTPDQSTASTAVKKDMESSIPMDRLVCGDVGFGKTEIAIRAAFKAVSDNKQVAVLVPTTILAFQHYQTFKKRLQNFPCTVDYINRFKSTKEKNNTLKDLKEGKIDILIGTHTIVGKKVLYKDLGLLIIDEEQKFGVAVKDKLKKIKVNIDTITLTATPIPRTMQFSMLGARDLSIIRTPPPNRQSVHTELLPFSTDTIKEAIEYELYRGGQIYFVHNRVKDLLHLKSMIEGLVPHIDIGIAHGKIEGHLLENILLDFIDKKYDLLLSTNIIEAGIDIPNANTIIINNAHGFGMSDLHQLRGRVGRSNKKAFCYLLAPPLSSLTKESRQRLKTIEEFSELGDGFQVSMRDLDIRGAGNLLGGEQSGFISEIGYDTYHKILDEAIKELKETTFKDLYPEEQKQSSKQHTKDCQIDTDLDMHIPNWYVNSSNERLLLYSELNQCQSEKDIKLFEAEITDRFGPIPNSLTTLFDGIRLKWIALQLGIERILLKKGILNCYFIQDQNAAFYQSPTFTHIIQYIQLYPYQAELKEKGKYLVLKFQEVSSIHMAIKKLTQISDYCP